MQSGSLVIFQCKHATYCRATYDPEELEMPHLPHLRLGRTPKPISPKWGSWGLCRAGGDSSNGVADVNRAAWQPGPQRLEDVRHRDQSGENLPEKSFGHNTI